MVVGESKVWDLSLISSVPSGRIYNVLDELMVKGLVKSNNVFPMRVRAILMRTMDRRLKKILYSLKPYRASYNKHTRVFEPSYRRG